MIVLYFEFAFRDWVILVRRHLSLSLVARAFCVVGQNLGMKRNDRSKKGVVPQGLNWLNVSETVQTSIQALDSESIALRHDLQQINEHVMRIENRMESLERANERLFDLLQIERERNDQLSQQISKISLENILHQVSLLFKPERIVPEEIRATLRRVDQSAPQLNKRLLALEQQQQQRKPSSSYSPSVIAQAAVELKKLAL